MRRFNAGQSPNRIMLIRHWADYYAMRTGVSVEIDCLPGELVDLRVFAGDYFDVFKFDVSGAISVRGEVIKTRKQLRQAIGCICELVRFRSQENRQ